MTLIPKCFHIGAPKQSKIYPTSHPFSDCLLDRFLIAWLVILDLQTQQTQSKPIETQTKHSQAQIGPKKKSAEGGGAKHNQN